MTHKKRREATEDQPKAFYQFTKSLIATKLDKLHEAGPG
jgi:hypothetical protein